MFRSSFFIFFLSPLLLGKDLHEDKPLTIQGTVNSENESEFSINVSSKRPLRIVAEVIGSSKEAPVLFSLRREDSQHSWRIPGNDHEYNRSTFRKVLCEGSLQSHTMRLFVSSRSTSATSFSVQFELIPKEDFELKLSSSEAPAKGMETRISPTEMALYQFVPPKEEEYALLVVKGPDQPEDQFCSVLSIQPRLRCPEIHDQERDMRSGSDTQFQTFLGTAALVIDRSRYPDGIHLVLLVQEKDKGCYQKEEAPEFRDSNRAMNVTIKVQKLEASKMESTVAILVFYLVIAVVAGCLSHFTFRWMLFEFEGKFGTLHKRTLERREKKKKLRKDSAATIGAAKAVIRFRKGKSGSATDERDASTDIELNGVRSKPATPRAHALHQSRTTGRAGSDREDIPAPHSNSAFEGMSPPETQISVAETSPRSQPSTARAHALHESRTVGRAATDKEEFPSPPTTPSFGGGPPPVGSQVSIDETTPCCGGSPKPSLESKQPLVFFWQDSKQEEEEVHKTVDVTDRAIQAPQPVRIRHASEATAKEMPAVQQIITLDKEAIKTKRANSKVMVEDMSVRANPEYFPNYLWKRSDQFVWNVFIVGIYYTLPVFQLVLYYQNVSLEKGDMDTCYFNFLCLYPWGPIADFGHVFSNIGYIICGLFFILIVKNRSRKYQKFCNEPLIAEEELANAGEDPRTHPKFSGIPESYGIFYAMGGALIMEGVLSGCYHICPTAENFQFDTTFMYAIAVLVFLKVYQFRHTDITSTGHFVFMWIGFALTFEMVGYFTTHILFWVLFIVIYVAFVFTFVVHVYYHATGPNIRDRCTSVFDSVRNKKFFEALCDTCSLQTMQNVKRRRLIPALMVILVNIGVAIFIAMKRKAGVSRYLLVILMANMMLYINYYIGHKLYYRLRRTNWHRSEGFRLITILYFFLMLIMGGGAVYFFAKELKTSAGTAAESRNLNDACFMLIFDNHDMWHFFSAAGLFFLFMFILTLEDYNKEKPRNRIPVF